MQTDIEVVPWQCISVVNSLEHHVQWSVMHLKSRGSQLGPGASALHQRIISINSYVHE